MADLGTIQDKVTVLTTQWNQDTNDFIYRANAQVAGAGTNRKAADRAIDRVSVVDAGADKTGVADSTAAFNSIISSGKKCYVPAGTYSVSDIAVVAGMDVEGELDGLSSKTILEVRTNSTAAF